jgi:hypothetical protein
VELPPGTEATLHVTAELKAPVPVNVAEHCEVSPVCTEVGLQEAETEVMVGGTTGGLSVMAAEADLDESAKLVAVSVTVAVALMPAGAVYVTPEVVDALNAPAPFPMLHETPALVASF